MALFIARWPDGSAWILEAESMPDVAEILDEVADPGACEVQEYTGPFAIELRPVSQPQDGAIFEFSLTDGDTAYDMQQALLEAAFPGLQVALDAAMGQESGGEPKDEDWAEAIARELDRELVPSSEWAESVRMWWEARTGVPADRSAALRDMQDVTIPGEPKIETPEQRELFQRAQHQITKRIVDLLATPKPKPPKRPRPPSTGRRPPKRPSGSRRKP
ncbi:MAG TPA: hypothetical protein VFT22_44215 [Kofleriaceae bacterium]|nr:hypothetical protein [Kofleriaceae bacterium]